MADAIRGSWADAGVCLKLASDEADLTFLSVRRESYEICFPESLADDPRLAALAKIVRMSHYRRLLGELPGYDVRTPAGCGAWRSQKNDRTICLHGR